jgi:hypothetical protein
MILLNPSRFRVMVGAAGLEPATLCLEGRCSIHLSYAPLVSRSRLPKTGICPNYLLTVALSTSVPRGTLRTMFPVGHFASIA